MINRAVNLTRVMRRRIRAMQPWARLGQTEQKQPSSGRAGFLGAISILQLDLITIPQIAQQRLYFGCREVSIEEKSPTRRTRRPACVAAHAVFHQFGLDSRAASPGSTPEDGVCSVKISLWSLHFSPYGWGTACSATRYYVLASKISQVRIRPCAGSSKWV